MRRITCPDDLTASQVDDVMALLNMNPDFVAYNTQNGSPFSLNDTEMFLWQCIAMQDSELYVIDDHGTVDAVAALLVPHPGEGEPWLGLCVSRADALFTILLHEVESNLSARGWKTLFVSPVVYFSSEVRRYREAGFRVHDIRYDNDHRAVQVMRHSLVGRPSFCAVATNREGGAIPMPDPSPRGRPALPSLSQGNIFVESESLIARVDATYDLLAEVFRADLPADVSAPAAHKASDDPVFRRWLDDRLAVERGSGASAGGPLRAPLVRSAEEWARTATNADAVSCATTIDARDEWETRHAELFQEDLNPQDNDIHIAAASAHEARVLLDAVRLLNDVIPDVARATLPHTRIVYALDGSFPIASVTSRRLPRATYIHRSMWADSLILASLLLHESVHQKLYDLQLLYSLRTGLRRAVSTHDSSGLAPSWRRVAT